MNIKEEKFTLDNTEFQCFTIDEDNKDVTRDSRGGVIFESMTKMNEVDSKTTTRGLEKSFNVHEIVDETQLYYELIYSDKELKEANIIRHNDTDLNDVSVDELLNNSELLENVQIKERGSTTETLLSDSIGQDGKLRKRFLGSKLLVGPLIKLLDRDYKVFKINVDKIFEGIYSEKTMIEEFVYPDSTEKFVERNKQIVDKSYWKNDCLDRHEFKVKLNRKLKNFPPFEIQGERGLVFFQGLNKNKTGFFEFLAQHNYLTELQSIYGSDIFLLTYPTWFESVPAKIDSLKSAFEAMNLDDNTSIDFVCTSTGSVVGRGLVYELRNSVNIRSIICVNGPNVGTPIAELTNVGKLLGFASYFLGPVASSALKISSSLINKMIGVEDLRGTSKSIPTINENYNSLNRTNDYFIGTEARSKGDVFNDKPNDGVIPVASMKGKILSDSTYGYNGPIVNVADENIMIIPLDEGALKHGKQYRNIAITDYIMEKLRVPLLGSGGGEVVASAD